MNEFPNQIINAFPSTVQYFPDDTSYKEKAGMTLLDYFAAEAMKPMLTLAHSQSDPSSITDKSIAKRAYNMATAMMEVRGA
jgi:hypothetical protein